MNAAVITPAAQLDTITIIDNDSGLLSEVKALTMPDMAREVRRASAALRMADSFVVATAEDYQLCADELKSVVAKKNALEALRNTVANPLYQAWKALNALFKLPMDSLTGAETKLKSLMLTFSAEQERLAADVRRKADIAAAAERKKLADAAAAVLATAEAERVRLANIEANRVKDAQAEQARLAEEARCAIAAGNKEAAEAAERKANEAFEASEASAQLSREQTAQVREEAITESASLQMAASVTCVAVLPVNVPKAAGISNSKTVEFEVIDLLALVKHIAANPEHLNLVVADSVKLRNYVRSLGLNTKLPGVRVFHKTSVSVRA